MHIKEQENKEEKSQEYYDYWGRDDRTGSSQKRLVEEQKELSKYCEKGKGLDLGCGWIKCHENATGMDVYPYDSVEIVGNCADLHMFKDNELDFIVNSHLLEHLPDTCAALEEWKRVLKPGGILAIAVPDGEIKPKYILYNGHKANLGLNTLGYMLRRKLGMKIIRAEHVKKNSPNKHVALIVVKKR